MGAKHGKEREDDAGHDSDTDETAGASTSTGPGIPLTSEERSSILKSWKTVEKDKIDIGMSMYIGIAQGVNSGLSTVFGEYDPVDTEKLRKDENLRSSATKVMTALDKSIKALDADDNDKSCIKFLHKIGKMYCKGGADKSENLWTFEEPFIGAMKEALGGAFTKDIESIYRKAYHDMVPKVMDGFEECKRKENA